MDERGADRVAEEAEELKNRAAEEQRDPLFPVRRLPSCVRACTSAAPSEKLRGHGAPGLSSGEDRKRGREAALELQLADELLRRPVGEAEELRS